MKSSKEKKPATFDHRVEHLLVDLDGTILGNRALSLSFDFMKKALGALHSHGGWKKALQALIAIQRELSRPVSEITPETANDYRVVKEFSRKLNLPPEEGRKVLREGIALIFPTLERHFYPITGAKDFLDWARNHYPMTLATNPVWPPEIVELRIRWAGVDPSMFKMITHVRQMHSCKPSRSYYEEILSLQGLKPEQCLLIGNEIKMDLPATVLGIPVFIVGHYKELTPLKYPHAKAQGWRGSYKDLQRMLSEQLAARTTGSQNPA